MSFTEETLTQCLTGKVEASLTTNNGIKDQGMGIDSHDKANNSKDNHSINKEIQITSRDLLSKAHKS